MKKILFLFFAIPLLVFSQKIKTIEGTVTDGATPLDNVHVYIQDSEVGTYTDQKGKYKLDVQEGKKLVFSYQGKSQDYSTDRISSIFDVVLSNLVNELEGVTLEKSKYTLRSQKELMDAYNVDEDIIKSKFLLIDKKVAGYAMEIRQGDEINNASTNIMAMLQSMFAGVKISPKGSPMVRMSPDDPTAVIYMRGAGASISNPIEAVYDVDGMLYIDPPRFLDLQNITRVARIPGLAGTNLYGSLGAGGVFIINTKSENSSPTKENLAFRTKQRLINNEKIQVISREQAKKNWPTYLQDYYKISDFKSAESIYLKYEREYQALPQFYLDSYEYFSNELDEISFADSIISNKSNFLSKKPENLRALAFLYESQGRYNKENEVTKRLFSIQSNMAQVYLQLANSYRNLGQPKKAMSIYARYKYLIDDGFLAEDTIAFSPILNRERDNLLKLEKGKFEKKTIKETSSIRDANYNGTRLVFEWNDIEAEFELQFVNPNGQSFVWEHTLASNPHEVSLEKEYGYAVKEFLLDGSMPGLWTVNTSYIGNTSATPTYLKATIYYNFGLKNQRKEVQVFKLILKNVNQELFSTTVPLKTGS
jgi:tetratricopeptide (TPR) repeat protein